MITNEQILSCRTSNAVQLDRFRQLRDLAVRNGIDAPWVEAIGEKLGERRAPEGLTLVFPPHSDIAALPVAAKAPVATSVTRRASRRPGGDRH